MSFPVLEPQISRLEYRTGKGTRDCNLGDQYCLAFHNLNAVTPLPACVMRTEAPTLYLSLHRYSVKIDVGNPVDHPIRRRPNAPSGLGGASFIGGVLMSIGLVSSCNVKTRRPRLSAGAVCAKPSAENSATQIKPSTAPSNALMLKLPSI